MNNNWKKKFAFIWAGQAFSLIGSSAVQFAIIWYLAVKTGSAMTMTFAGLAGFLPQALLGPFAGAWVDRVSRKMVMMCADSFVALASALLAAAFMLGTPPEWFVYTVLFLRACGSVFHTPAMQAAIPMLAPREALMKVGGWGQFINSASCIIGPAIGSLCYSVLSMQAVMMVDVTGALLAVGTLAFVKIPDPPKSLEEKHILHEIAEGFRELKSNSTLMVIMWPFLIASLLYIPASTLYPLMTSNHFMGNAWHASVVEIAFAVGMLLTSFLLGIKGAKHRYVAISMGIGIFGLAMFVSGMLPQSGFWIFVLMSLTMGGSGNYFSVPFMVLIQETVARESLGRVFSLITCAMCMATPLGLFIAGPLAEKIGVAAFFAISGGIMALLGIYTAITTRKYDKIK